MQAVFPYLASGGKTSSRGLLTNMAISPSQFEKALALVFGVLNASPSCQRVLSEGLRSETRGFSLGGNWVQNRVAF